jgi:hypothetical protein
VLAIAAAAAAATTTAAAATAAISLQLPHRLHLRRRMLPLPAATAATTAAATRRVVREERTLYAGVQFESAALKRLCEALAAVPGMEAHTASVRTAGTFAVTLADSPQGR